MSTPLPDRFVEIMRERLGDDAERLFAALDTEPAVSLRLNPMKPAESFEGESVGWCKWGRYLAERPQFTLDPLLHGGAYYVQEASSMFLYYILGKIMSPHEPIRVLDLCAAPGGKSTLVASELPHGSLLVANEVIKSRA